MRIIAGRWRGRSLVSPAGMVTRPTAERLRQALFDMIWHASWGGRELMEDALVLDMFAGTGALGLEALSRGAARAEFFETDRAALAALRINIAACGAEASVFGDACRPAPGAPARLVFLDPPYGRDLVGKALAGLKASGRLAPGCVLVAEISLEEAVPGFAEILADRSHGAGRMVIGR